MNRFAHNRRFAAAWLGFLLLVSHTVAGSPNPVSDLRATSDGERVSLQWSLNGEPTELILFRSRMQIMNTEALAGATQIATPTADAGRFIDYPVPGVPAYYALISAEAIAAGTIALEPNRNITTRPATLPLGARNRDTEFFTSFVFRSSPLPYLEPWQGMLEGRNNALPRALPPQPVVALAPAVEQAVSRLMTQTTPLPPPRRPAVLPDHGEADGKGVAFTLKSIVDGPFSAGRWEQTREFINNLLTLPVPADVEAGARFYLGQTYYFEGMYDRAVLEFVLARRHHHAMASAWIDDSLRRGAVTAARVQR